MPPADPRRDDHPDLQVLASRASGILDAEVSARVDAHVGKCELCRLELKRAARFQAMDQDEEAAAEARWDEAEKRLDAAWRTRQRPVVVKRIWHRPRWLVGLAAAVLVLMVVGVREDFFERAMRPETEALRGGPEVAPTLTAQEPVGELAQAPTRFRWSSEGEAKSFAIDVFTEELGTIFQLRELTGEQVILPDSLRARLAPAVTYFWYVEEREGLAATAVSPTVWFRFRPVQQDSTSPAPD